MAAGSRLISRLSGAASTNVRMYILNNMNYVCLLPMLWKTS